MAEQKAPETLPRAMRSAKNKYEAELRETAKKIATRGKGILAADESTGTIGKRLSSISVENNEANRRRYRELLFSTKGWGEYCSGVILYDETIRQKAADGTPFVKMIQDAGVIPGIKVDLGARELPYCEGETYTQGLTDLDKRCAEYYTLGARFAKWRAVLKIQNGYCSQTSILENAWTLARYAAICQANGLCPIVEPELLMDGTHTLETCKYWTEKILSACYKALVDQEVILEGTLLKPNMVLPGKDCKGKQSFEANAKATVEALKRTVPAAVPGIMFLSGGQSEEEATNNLNELNKQPDLPWSLSFSYGRALQQSCLRAWKGDDKLVAAGQAAFLNRAKANGMAQLGKYDGFAATEEAKKSLYQKGYVY
jgi:fructose-bisphosphate aldolase class I